MILKSCLWGCLFCALPTAAFAIDFGTEVLPILQANCIRCHGAELQEGNLRLDTLSTDLLNDRAATEHWHDVLNVLDAGEMPPEDEPQLTSQDHEKLTSWLSVEIKEAIEARRKTDGRVVLRRLNRVEYQNTMRDLLGLDMDYARDLPPDAISADGFQNDGRSLQMSPLQLEYYLSTARRALDRVIVSGDKPTPFDHTFTESKIDTWLGNAERSNRLGRQQEFLAKIVNDYPDDGDFLLRIRLSAELKPNTGYPLLEVSVGYQPDTEILLDSFEWVEIKSAESQTLEFRGRLENFPLPVRGQGKFPGLVVRIRNRYDDKSPKPAQQKDANGKAFYPDEPHLPTITVESLEFHGNAYEQWPPATHRQILHDAGDTDRENVSYVQDVLKRFMSRAFRRPVEESELSRMVEFYQTIRPEFPSFEEAIRETLAMVLIQPAFLFRIEPAGEEKRPVSDVELASRLSYFLWSTMPDDRLLDLANAGRLHEADVLTSEVDRMLADPRSKSFIHQFTDQWLSLNAIDNIAINRDRYPDFDDAIKPHMANETRELFSLLLRENLSALNLLSSDFAMLNEPLAKHYEIEGVYGQAVQKVTLPADKHRGGLLSQASILLINSTGADSHPVRRAVWIRDRLLNDPPAPPPPNVPSLQDADPKFHELSVREQLEIHRTQESCNRCHKNIDPWGIALENFDAVGRWRTETTRKVGDETKPFPVNSTETLPGGHVVEGVDGLKKHLVNDQKQAFAASLVSRLLTYALGRTLELGDQDAVQLISQQLESDDFRMNRLIHHIVNSVPFQTK
jgi:hypothetical protein